MKKNTKTVTSTFLDSAWDWSPGTLFPGYRIGHVAELMIATSGKNDADDFHDECYIAPPSAGNLPATTTILRRSRAEMAIGNQLGVEYRGIVQNKYGIGGVLHISLSLDQQLPSHQNAILLQTSQLASAQTRGEKERKISLARFQLSRHTTHKRTKKKKVKLHGDVPFTSYLLPFSLNFYFFFLHMHACMPTEQKKAQDRKKKKEISNRNCKAGNLDTACRLPLQELINTCLLAYLLYLYIAYLTFILFFSNFSFLFLGFSYRL